MRQWHHKRRIVDRRWPMRVDMTRDIVTDAPRMAWFKHHPDKQAALIFTADATTP